jgi:hypothetical protein
VLSSHLSTLACIANTSLVRNIWADSHPLRLTKIIPSSNFLRSLIKFQIFLERLVLPIPGGPKILTSLFSWIREMISHISCCLPRKHSTLGGIESKICVFCVLVKVPGFKFEIGKHLCFEDGALSE